MYVKIGIGLIVISTVIGEPIQIPIEGVIVYLTIAGKVDVLISDCEIVLPLLAANPEAVPLINAAVHE